MRLVADVVGGEGKVKMTLRAVESYYPHEMLPVARFLVALVAPNRLTIHAENGDRISEYTEIREEPWMERWMPAFLEGLVLVQTAAGMVRKVPATIDVAEMNAIGTAAALLRGERVGVTWDRVVMTVQSKHGVRPAPMASTVLGA